MSNEEMSEELREAIRRGLEASVAPGADIYLTYEESEALWAAARTQPEVSSAQGTGRSLIRNVRLGSASRSLYTRVTRAPQTTGSGGQVLAGQA